MPSNFGSTSESSKIVRFGFFGFVVNQVMLESGASYTLPGILDRNGELRTMKGKRLATPQEILQSGKPTGRKLDNGKPELHKGVVDHLIVLLRAKNRNGEEYLKTYEVSCMNKDAKWMITRKSLEAVFGKDYGSTVKPVPQVKLVTWFPAKAEEVPTGQTWEGTNGTQDERALKFVAQFADEKTMREAETKHFAQFGNQDETPAASNGNGANNEVYDKALKLWQAFKGDDAKFKAAVLKDAAQNSSSIYAGQDVDTLLVMIHSDKP